MGGWQNQITLLSYHQPIIWSDLSQFFTFPGGLHMSYKKYIYYYWGGGSPPRVSSTWKVMILKKGETRAPYFFICQLCPGWFAVAGRGGSLHWGRISLVMVCYTGIVLLASLFASFPPLSLLAFPLSSSSCRFPPPPSRCFPFSLPGPFPLHPRHCRCAHPRCQFPWFLLVVIKSLLPVLKS